jgi:Flp pilus assembly secretin CpaC
MVGIVRFSLALFLAFASSLSPSRADDTTIVATVDQAKLVKIPPGTETLIIGNPTIADVTLLKRNNVMILVPKSYGETNFIALDSNGAPVAESVIRVIDNDSSLVVQRGFERQSYSCAPRCQPVERLGDDAKYLSDVAAQDVAHHQRLATSTPPVGVGLSH